MAVPPFPIASGDGVGAGTPSEIGPSASNLPSNVGSFVPPNIQSLATRVITQAPQTGTQQTPAQASSSQGRPPLPPPSSADGTSVASGSGLPNGNGEPPGNTGGRGRSSSGEPRKDKKGKRDKKGKKDKSGDDGGDDGDGDTTSTDDGSSSSSDRRSRRSRRKKRSTAKVSDFTLHALPAVPGFPAWKQSVENKMVAAVDYKEDKVFVWINRIFDFTFETNIIRDIPKKLKKADAKLRTAVTDILHGSIGREIHLKIEEIKKAENRILTGAETLRAVAGYYATHEDMNISYTLEDLNKVKFTGDNNLRNFMNSWRRIVNEVKSTVPEHILREMFLTQISQSTVMANDVAHYRRLPDYHEDKTRTYLEGLVWKYLDRQLKEANRAQEIAAFNQRLTATPTAPDVTRISAAAGGIPPLELPPNRNPKKKVCEFYFNMGGKKGPCRFGDSCSNSHLQKDYEALVKKKAPP